MTHLLRGLAVVTGLAFTGVLVIGSALPWTAGEANRGLLRLSWRAVGERMEACREPSAEELAALPPHMRQSAICEARLTPFQLDVELDGRSLLDTRVHPSGARGDRPAYVREEFLVEPGEHRLSVRFVAIVPDDAEPRPTQELDESIRVEPGRIVLITRDERGLYRVEP